METVGVGIQVRKIQGTSPMLVHGRICPALRHCAAPQLPQMGILAESKVSGGTMVHTSGSFSPHYSRSADNAGYLNESFGQIGLYSRAL